MLHRLRNLYFFSSKFRLNLTVTKFRKWKNLEAPIGPLSIGSRCLRCFLGRAYPTVSIMAAKIAMEQISRKRLKMAKFRRKSLDMLKFAMMFIARMYIILQ